MVQDDGVGARPWLLQSIWPCVAQVQSAVEISKDVACTVLQVLQYNRRTLQMRRPIAARDDLAAMYGQIDGACIVTDSRRANPRSFMRGRTGVIWADLLRCDHSCRKPTHTVPNPATATPTLREGSEGAHYLRNVLG